VRSAVSHGAAAGHPVGVRFAAQFPCAAGGQIPGGHDSLLVMHA
jgi:hypothetical protein